MKDIIIFDTTLRDGEQSPGASLNIDEKLLVAHQLEKLGVDVIEAGFPIASKGDFEAVKQVAQSIKNSTVCGLARANKIDIMKCWDAVKYAKKPRIHTFIATSKVHMEDKLKKTKEEVIEITKDAVTLAKSLCDDVEFSPEDAGRTNLDYMCDVVRAAIKAGATTINIPDTVGYTEPKEFGDRIKYLFDKVPEVKDIVVSVHCHNDLGNAVANSLSAIENGATQIEGCINGIGERAGNAAIEEVIMNLKTRKDYFNVNVNVNTKELFRTSRLVSNLTGINVQRNKAIVGENAFAHEAGIHQHGILANKNTYEIMIAEDIGWEGENIVIGKHSGKHAIKKILDKEGLKVTKEQLIEITGKIKHLADTEKEIEFGDVIGIGRDVAFKLAAADQYIKLLEYSVTTGNKITPTATVKLEVYGEEKIGSGVGNGPIDAISSAIWSMIETSLKLVKYNLKSITGGTNALANVSIKLSDIHNHIYGAKAVSEDVISASANALIDAINKALHYSKTIHPQKDYFFFD
ncbi:MAG: 2-isopropylmalate synthase [Candidatus Marinimicrobia bacterium]|nr:2-isopropylmalate synthase [Candidatus Neomarinimicrobiota bacterium]